MPHRNEQTVNIARQINEVALAAEQAAEPAGDRQHDAVGDEIGGQRPGRFVVARRQTAGDVRQRDIDDRRVENLHEGRERDDDRDRPGIVPRFPAEAERVLRRAAVGFGGNVCGAARRRRRDRAPTGARQPERLLRAHCTFTLGTTERPSESGSFGSRPESMSIFTGTRWTILTKLPVAFSGGKAVKRDPVPS